MVFLSQINVMNFLSPSGFNNWWVDLWNYRIINYKITSPFSFLAGCLFIYLNLMNINFTLEKNTFHCCIDLLCLLCVYIQIGLLRTYYNIKYFPRKLNWYVSTLTEVFLNHTVKMTPLDSFEFEPPGKEAGRREGRGDIKYIYVIYI